jgi:hypothetical protein
MARQRYDLHLTRYDEKGGRAAFYTTGMEQSPTSARGTGWGAHDVYRRLALPRSLGSRGRTGWQSQVTASDRSRLPSSRHP